MTDQQEYETQLTDIIRIAAHATVVSPIASGGVTVTLSSADAIATLGPAGLGLVHVNHTALSPSDAFSALVDATPPFLSVKVELGRADRLGDGDRLEVQVLDTHYDWTSLWARTERLDLGPCPFFDLVG